MIAVVTILTAFPLGFFLRDRLAASTTYAIAYLWAFVFQGIDLMLDSLEQGRDPAFVTSEFPLSYGMVTLTVFAVGFELVQLGYRVGRGRRERRLVRSGSSPAGSIVGAASENTAAGAHLSG